MTFKKFMTVIFKLPGTLLSGVLNILFGFTQKDKNGTVVLDENDDPVVYRGLFGLILDGFKFVTRSLADFIANHKTAVSIAFWSSLVVAGAVALTLFLWPAALTAVATFSIGGMSIAEIVGANTLLQIGFAAGLAAAATSVVTYIGAAVVNTVAAIVNFCIPSAKKVSSKEEIDLNGSDEQLIIKNANPLNKLNRSSPKLLNDKKEELPKDKEPVHTKTILKDSPKIEKPKNDPVIENGEISNYQNN